MRRFAVLAGLCFAAVCAAWAQVPSAKLGYTFVPRRGSLPYTIVCRAASQWRPGNELRLALDYASPDDLYLLSISRESAVLRRIERGEERELARAALPGLRGEEEIFVQRRPGRIAVIVGGEVVLRASAPGSLEGRVGWAAHGVQVHTLRVQPVAEVYFSDDFARPRGDPGQWAVARGSWTNTVVNAPRANPNFSANPFSVCASGTQGALSIAGSPYWDNYRFRASVRPTDAQSVGILGYVQDAANYITLRWRAGGRAARGAKQLVLVRHGNERVLAQADGGFVPGQWYRLELRFAPGAVEGWIDRERVLVASTDAFGQGKIGLWAQGREVFFDDVLATSGAETLEPLDCVPRTLREDRGTVGEVYSSAIAWRTSDDGAIIWHRGVFFHDVAMRVPLDPDHGGPHAVIVRAPQGSPKSGYVVRCAWQGKELELALERDGAVLCRSKRRLRPEPGQELSVRFRDGAIAVASLGEELLRYEVAGEPPGRSVGVVTSTPELAWGTLVSSDHQLEYTFAEAPTDFFVSKGRWGITTRWQCEPEWTFFGGDSDENPTVLTKHAYRGDVVAEFFMSLAMQAGVPIGYPHASDLNISACVAGLNPGTGYSFIVAGWKNTKTAILRRERVVAQTDDFLFVEPTTRNTNFHRHWFRVRVEKVGRRVSLAVDDQPLLHFEDPQPLEGGRIALWSFRNWLCVARGYIWFAEEEPAPLPELPRVQRLELPHAERRGETLFCDFERDAGEWHAEIEGYPLPTILALDETTAASGKRSLKITNATVGGPFAAYCIAKPLRLQRYPVVSFDYRLPPEVKVNFYLLVNGAWHVVRLSAEQPEESGVNVLGEFPGVVADGTWRHTSFNLLSALKKLYPEHEYFDAQQIAFASPQLDYVRCGIGGNPLGASFWIDNFRLGPAANTKPRAQASGNERTER